MSRQRIATATLPGWWAASPSHGTVHSLESARRQRVRRPVPGGVVRVLIVGRQAITRAGLRRLLEDEAGLSVVAEAASGAEAARLLGATVPHVVLLDASHVEPDPAACARMLAGRVAVLLLSERDPDDRILAALRAGATGVLLKDSHPAALASAVRTIAAGGALLPPRTTRRLITELVSTPPCAPG
jgi:DNA-binding NarL/FixJ family response regulator